MILYPKRAAILYLCCIACSMAGTLPAMTQGFSPADVQRLQTVSDPVFSPDGKTLVYSVGAVDAAQDAEVTDLWAVAYQGGTPIRLTDTPDNEWQAIYAPDGQIMYFLADYGESKTTQVWQMPSRGGTATLVTHYEQGVDDYAVSPDGRHIVVVVKDSDRPAGASKPIHPKPIVTTRFQFKEDITGYLDGRYKHLYLVDVSNGQGTQLSFGAHDEYLPAFSPDGERIAFVTKRGADIDRHLNWDIYSVEAKAGGEEKQITTFTGSDLDPYWETRPAWSPDGKKIAYARSGESKWIYYMPWQLAVVDVQTGRETQPALVDQFVIKPQWARDSRHIFALLEGPQTMHAVKVDSQTGRVQTLTNGARFDYGLAVNRRDQIVVNGSTPRMPFELQRIDSAHQPTYLTQHNAFVQSMPLASTEVVAFTSKDGTPLQGLVVKPAGYQKGKRYPTILRIHGGPVYQFSQEFMYDWQAYANAGFVVLAVNPRGSSGKGFAFAKAIYADWGHVDVQDVLAGVDYVVQQGIADPERLGVGGWSYGSILTNYVIASDIRFKAAVSGAGTSNMLANYGYDQYSREYELELGTPWANKAAYERVSYPFFKSPQITTPTLFQCAEWDFNVPCIGAQQMYQALRSQNKDTQLIIYPGQNHGLTIPSYLQDRITRNIAWYQKYLMP